MGGSISTVSCTLRSTSTRMDRGTTYDVCECGEHLKTNFKGEFFNDHTEHRNIVTGEMPCSGKRRASTCEDLHANPIILRKIREYLDSEKTKVVILTHNRRWAKGSEFYKSDFAEQSFIETFLAKHIGEDSGKIEVRVARGDKSIDIQKLGIQVFFEDSLNVLQEIDHTL